MKNQENILKTLSYLEVKSCQQIKSLSVATFLFDAYRKEFLNSTCRQLMKQILDDPFMTLEQKKQARKLINHLMVPGKGIDKLQSDFKELQKDIRFLRDQLQKLQYKTRPQAIANSIETRLKNLQRYSLIKEKNNFSKFNENSNLIPAKQVQVEQMAEEIDQPEIINPVEQLNKDDTEESN